MKINVEIDGQIYQVEVEDIHSRPVVAIIEGERYEVWPETETPSNRDQTQDSAPEISVPETVGGSVPAPRQAAQSGSSKVLAAPLPGVIVAIFVKPGDAVKRGDELCTLEAMKMKNAIKSNRNGTIESVDVNVGDQVGHGQVLMTYKD